MGLKFENQDDEFDGGSLNTPKHFTSIVTPKPLRQYVTPAVLDADNPPPMTRTTRNSPRKVQTPNYQDQDESGEDIADETYEEIVDTFQGTKHVNNKQVVKKVDPAILDNMNIEISKNDVSDEQFNEITKSSKRRGKSSREHVKVEETPRVDITEEEEEVEDGSTDDDDGGEKGKIKIIRMGTEEVKKYAIIDHKENDEDDDDDYDREDREELYEDEVEAMENDPEAKAYLDSYCTDRTPEMTTLKVAKKYPSKQKFPCPKCPKVNVFTFFTKFLAISGERY